MTIIPRRTIEELVTRYQLEPELCDLYVEGTTDKSLFDWYLGRKDIDGVAIYGIDTVDVPEILPDVAENAQGNKGRTLTLAKLFSDQIDGGLKVYFLVDRDFDDYLGVKREGDNVLVTDYNCVESYVIGEQTLNKFFVLFLGLSATHAERFIADGAPILSELFIIRLVKQTVAPRMRWISPRRCFFVNDGKLCFAASDYIKRLLNANGHPIAEADFIAKVSDYKKQLTDDIRYCMQGHDFTFVLKIWISHMGGPGRSMSEDLILRGLLASIEIVELSAEPLFQNIETIYSSEA
jgi:hypothetical protein